MYPRSIVVCMSVKRHRTIQNCCGCQWKTTAQRSQTMPPNSYDFVALCKTAYRERHPGFLAAIPAFHVYGGRKCLDRSSPEPWVTLPQASD